MKCKHFPRCPLRNFEAKSMITSKWRKKYCEKDFLKCVRYQEAEKGISHPDNMLPDGLVYKNLKFA